jgi:hypothetical protein
MATRSRISALRTDGRLTIWLWLAAGLAACSAPAEPPQMPPPEVSVAKPLGKQITDWDEYTGRLAAVDAVEIRARVSGYLQSVHFREGAIVERGDCSSPTRRAFRIADTWISSTIKSIRPLARCRAVRCSRTLTTS